MKRRFKSITGNPLTAVLARNRAFMKPSETRKDKRVRFEGTAMDDGAPVRASSTGREATQSPRCGGAKTSEYAYFSKVKNGSSIHGHSCSLHKENERPKSSTINNLIGETSSASKKLKTSTKDLNFSVSGEVAGPSDHNHSVSRGSTYDKSDQIRSKEVTNNIKKSSSLLSEDVSPVGRSLISSPFIEVSEKSENQCSAKGIFSAKRLKLRQWVGHTSSFEVEKLNPKGFDLVSLLMSRLLPKGNENNVSSEGDADNSSNSLIFHESNNLDNGLHLSHKQDQDRELPKISSGTSSDIVLTELDGFASGFRSNYCKQSHFQDEFMDHDQLSESHIYRSARAQHGFPFCLPFESYRSSGSSHLNYLDEHGPKLEPGKVPEREPYRLLLEWNSELGEDRLNSSIVNHDIDKKVSTRFANSWDIDQQRIVDNVLYANMNPSMMDPGPRSKSRTCRSSHTQHGFPFSLPFKSYRTSGSSHFEDLDEFDSLIDLRRESYRLLPEWHSEAGKYQLSSSITNHDIEKNACSKLANSWNVDQQRITDNILDLTMCPSSLFSNYYLGSNTLPSYSPTDYLMCDFKPSFDDVKCSMAEGGKSSLALPWTSRGITLTEDENEEHILRNSNPFGKFGWKCISSAEDSVFHALQFHEEPFTPIYEGAFNHYFKPPMLQSSFINCPFLLNHVSKNIPHQDLCFDDYDSGLGYRKIL